MTVHVNDNGTVRRAASLFVNDSGTQREILWGYVNDAGTVRQVFSNVVITVGNETIYFFNPPNASVSYSLQSDGDIEKEEGLGNNSDIGDWLAPKSGMGNYEVRATEVSGFVTVPTSSAVDTWLSLGTTRTWYKESGSGLKEVVLLIEIRPAGGGAVLDSATITLQAEAAA